MSRTILRTFSVYGAVAVAFGSNAARAEEDAAPEVEMVVTGARVEEPIDRATSATELITRKEIEQSGARNAAELLEERLGVQVVRSFRGSSLQLRGLDPQYTLILLDGDRVPGQVDGEIDLSRYASENIERIEVVRGPGSALYGSDAVGGIVNIITRETKRDFEANALGSYGTRHTLDLTGMVGGRPVEPLSVQITGGWHRSDALVRPGQITTALSARDERSTAGRVAYQPDAHNLLVVRGFYLKDDLTGVDSGAGGAVFDRTQLQEQMRVGFEHRLKASPTLQLTSRLTYSQHREQYLLDQRGSAALDQYQDNREHLGQLASIATFEPVSGQRTTVGAEELFQDLESQRLSQSGQRFRFAAYAQHAWYVFEHDDHELEIVPGIRLDSDSAFGSAVSPKLALRYRPTGFFEVRASYGHGFRAPTFQEMLLRFENPSAGYVVVGNPNLHAETSDGFDAGLRFFTQKLEINVTGFRNDLRNMISYVMQRSSEGSNEFIYANLERAWTMGLETSAAYQVRDQISLMLAYTLLDTWDGENKRVLPGRAPHRVTANVRLAHPRWGIDFTGRLAASFGRTYFVSDSPTGDVERPVAPKPLIQADVRLAKHFDRYLEVFVGIDNIFDAGDAYAAFPPLTVYGGARGRYY